MLFAEIRADHTENDLNIEFKAKPIWALCRGGSGATAARAGRLATCYHFGAEDGTRTRRRHPFARSKCATVGWTSGASREPFLKRRATN